MKKILYILVTFLCLHVNAQNVSKKCKTCGKPISQCQYKGSHQNNNPKPNNPKPNNPGSANSQQTLSKTRAVSKDPDNEKIKAVEASDFSVVSTNHRVDLGLSICWAGYNLEASSPEQLGNKYAWGETEYRTNSDNWDNYIYKNGDNAKNLGTNICGTKYDVARKVYGGTWRLPSRNEIVELIECCCWQEIIYNDVYGMKVTGPNGNAIFLPYERKSNYGEMRKGGGDYQTGSTWNATSGSRICLEIWMGHVKEYTGYERGKFTMVRPVCK